MDTMVGFYAKPSVVKEFNALCKELHVNKSAFFRDKMEEFIRANH